MSDTVVLLSGGMASFEAGIRIITTNPKGIRFWFFDTLIEDEDLYRFLRDIERVTNIKVEYYQDGRNPWQVFSDEKFIGNSRADVCSRVLKRKLLTTELKKQYPNNNVKLVFGIDWTEIHRIDPINLNWRKKGIETLFPMIDPPYYVFTDYKNSLIEKEIPIPRLYTLGFTHNNCGGACVKAGISQWTRLLHAFPIRYKWHEENELQLRKKLHKNISILRNRKFGKTSPMTLRYLRWRITKTDYNSLGMPHINIEDDEACSCLIPMVNEYA